MIHLPPFSPLILMVVNVVTTVAIALFIKHSYRLNASALFAAKAAHPSLEPDAPGGSFRVVVNRDQAPAQAGATLMGVVRGTIRGVLYFSCGFAVLYVTDWLFLPRTGYAERWDGYRVAIAMAIIVLVAGQLRIRVASSGLWAFAFMLGFAISISLFGIVFVTIPAAWEQVQRGILYAILAIPGLMLVWWLVAMGLWTVYYMGRGALWLHLTLGRLTRASPLYIGMLFFWSWVIYFSITSQLPTGTEAFAKMGKFLLVPMLLYAALTSAGLLVMKLFTPKHQPVGLLFLRSFGERRRSERLFRTLAVDWTEIGPVYALNGPDIVDATLDSAMLSAFLSDNLESQFIGSDEAIEKRMRTIQSERAWDLKYRVEEFKCLGTIWINVFQRLLERCDVVLLDLRGFTEKNAGTAFELLTLLRSGQTHKALLLADETTSLEAVERIGRPGSRTPSDATGVADQVVLTEAPGRNGSLRREAMRRLLLLAAERRAVARRQLT